MLAVIHLRTLCQRRVYFPQLTNSGRRTLMYYLIPKRVLLFNKNWMSPVYVAKQVLSIGRRLCHRVVNCYAAGLTGEM